MAKTSYIELDDPTRLLYFKPLVSGDRFIFPRIRRKHKFLSRAHVKGLTEKSLLPQIAASWASLTTIQKAAWSSAAVYFGKTGWNYFVVQQVLRIKNSMSGLGSPSDSHQGKVGYINIGGSATHVLLLQAHPAAYWISKPVKGKKSMRELVRITEVLSLPLVLGISYKSSLTADGSNPSAKFYAKVHYTYQGQDFYKIFALDFGLTDDWTILSATLSSVPGLVISYNLYLELTDVQGELWFDNVKAVHGGQNWARDPYCNSIATEFTKAFVQVPKNWAPDDLPDGSFYDSIFIA